MFSSMCLISSLSDVLYDTLGANYIEDPELFCILCDVLCKITSEVHTYDVDLGEEHQGLLEVLYELTEQHSVVNHNVLAAAYNLMLTGLQETKNINNVSQWF